MNNNWISTKERMPEPGEEALVVVAAVRGKIPGVRFRRLGAYSEVNGWELMGWPAGMEFAVTHWMPLPELPPEEDCAEDYKQLFMDATAEIFRLKTELTKQEGKIAWLEAELENCEGDE